MSVESLLGKGFLEGVRYAWNERRKCVRRVLDMYGMSVESVSEKCVRKVLDMYGMYRKCVGNLLKVWQRHQACATVVKTRVKMVL